jgi:hypothetical protein
VYAVDCVTQRGYLGLQIFSGSCENERKMTMKVTLKKLFKMKLKDHEGAGFRHNLNCSLEM